MTQAKYSPLEFRSRSYLRNILPKCNACSASGRQAARHESVWLLPYKQWQRNYKLHCIFHLVMKATFFRLLYWEPLQHRLKIELAATGRPSRRSLTFIPGRGITECCIKALHTKMAGQNRILRKNSIAYYLKKWNKVWMLRWRRHTYIHTHTHIINTYIYTHIHIYIHTHMNAYMHTYKHTYIYTYTHTYINTHAHTYTHIHTHIYTYTHTYIKMSGAIPPFLQNSNQQNVQYLYILLVVPKDQSMP